jgi:CxxC-x17-CxxC domain-containing protein
MKNFQPGGLRNRKPDLGGRPFSDAGNYAPKKRFDGNQSFANKPAFNTDRGKKDVTLYDATCTTCGKSCQVPFRPDGKKPVLCRDCFSVKNESPTNSVANRDRFTPNEMHGRKYEKPAQMNVGMAPEFQNLVKQLAMVEEKVNNILTLIKASEKLAHEAPIVPAMTATSEAAPVKVRKPKKVTPAIKKAAVKKKVAKKAAVAKKVAKKATK